MLLKKKKYIINKKNFFLKYNFYQSVFKKGKKFYFLLDFFRGLKGSFLLKNIKKFKSNKNFFYNSFNRLNNLNNLNKYDYLLDDLNLNYLNFSNKILKKSKKKNIFLITLIERKNFYSLYLKNI
jgi:hypothetical protein